MNDHKDTNDDEDAQNYDDEDAANYDDEDAEHYDNEDADDYDDDDADAYDDNEADDHDDADVCNDVNCEARIEPCPPLIQIFFICHCCNMNMMSITDDFPL